MTMYIKWVARALAIFALAGLTGWSALALWIDGPPSRGFAGALAAAVVIVAAGCVLRVRPLTRGLAFGLLAPLLALGWWLSIPAANDRDWMADVARPPTAVLEGDILTVHNVRNFRYRSESDYDERWEARRYDLSTLVGADLYLSFWGPKLYAHTITSWEFANGSHLAVSIETRKERGEVYSALLGFFRQYELYYVAADESDVIGVRASHKGEQLRLYRIRGPTATARKLLLSYAQEMNQIAEQPVWYNALITNCTTVIWQHMKHLGLAIRFDWRVLANGYLDEYLYERGSVNRDTSFEVLREASDITARARSAAGAADFSSQIRAGLPERPPPAPE